MTDKKKKIIKGWFTNPRSFAVFIFSRCITHWIKDDERYLKILFWLEMGKSLNLENPKMFQEKLQWLKLHDRKPEYTKMVDKYEAKKYVASIIGEEYIIPTLGVWNSFDEIDFSKLPDKFVLKCTHDSGRVVICKDKSQFNIVQARRRINKAMRTNFYLRGREWAYKNVRPRIIAEKYMEDSSGELKDYKFFCFDGEPYCVQVDFGRFDVHRRNIYDMNWNFLPFENNTEHHYDESYIIEKPVNFQEMIEITRKLSKGMPHVRVDLYNINGSIFFGELTFFHGMGVTKFHPKKWSYIMGDLIKLPHE